MGKWWEWGRNEPKETEVPEEPKVPAAVKPVDTTYFAENILARQEARNRWKLRAKENFENFVVPEPKYRIKQYDNIWAVQVNTAYCAQYIKDTNGHSIPPYLYAADPALNKGSYSFYTPEYYSVEDYDNDKAEVYTQWVQIGPQVTDYHYGYDNRSRPYNRPKYFTTYSEAENWLNLFLIPSESETYFTKEFKKVEAPLLTDQTKGDILGIE